MRNLILSIIFLCCATGAVAQVNEPNSVQVTEIVLVKDTPDTLANGETVYEAVDAADMPQFPGGNNAMYSFLGSNIQYPSEAAENEIQGKVIIKFVVKADGSIGATEIVKSVHPALDAEAERLVKLMPKWTPGRHNGKPVNVWFTLPVNFKLQGANSSTPSVSDRDQADYDNFLRLGDEALLSGNTNHAYQYFKECFNIKPTEFFLIEKIDSLLSQDRTLLKEFHTWAGDRLMREIDKAPANTVYIDNMISLLNLIIDGNQEDLSPMLSLAYMYSIKGDKSSFQNTINHIYSLTENNDPAMYASAVAIEANPYYNQGLFQETMAIIEPKLNILKKQSSDLTAIIWLSDVYMQMNRENDAANLLKWVKLNNPTLFNQLMDSWKETSSEYYQKLSYLIK